MNENFACSSLSIRDKLERSSLGTPQARRERARIADRDAQVIVSRAAAYPVEDRGRGLGGHPPKLHLYQGVSPIQPLDWLDEILHILKRRSHELP